MTPSSKPKRLQVTVINEKPNEAAYLEAQRLLQDGAPRCCAVECASPSSDVCSAYVMDQDNTRYLAFLCCDHRAMGKPFPIDVRNNSGVAVLVSDEFKP